MDDKKKLTKAERIHLRRERVAARRALKDGKSKGKGRGLKEEEEVLASKKELGVARERVDGAKLDGERQVTDIVVDRDYVEGARRKKDEETRGERMDRLERELLESTRVNRDIELKWSQVAQEDVPQTLYEAIATQYKAAASLLGSKDEIIKSLQTELKVKDEDYVELLAQHQEDVVELVKRMKEHFAHLYAVCQEQLLGIEKVHMEERAETLAGNKEKMNELFQKRIDLELQILYSKQAREDEFESELAAIRSNDAEKYNELKVVLETNIQLLEQQLEDMRATYQLNTEKLEYNHIVLEERDAENQTTVLHHSNRLRRLKEALSLHKQRFMKQDTKFKQENKELTDAYKRATEHFKDLQKKFKHFQTVDNKRYADVRAMNEGEVMGSVKKLLKADELVHEQVLGLDYTPIVAPDGTPVPISLTTSADIMRVPGADDPSGSLGRTMGLDGGAGGGAGGDEEDGEEGTSGAALLAGQGVYSPHQVKQVMDSLTAETSFLVDARLKETVRGLPEDEQEMYKVDSILASLGVEDREDLDELVGCFFDGPNSDIQAVHPNDVVKVVREFVVKRQTKGKGGLKTSNMSSQKKERKKEREVKFWKRLGTVLPQRTERVWDALEKTLREYNKVLEGRSGLIDETTELARQNEELKQLLHEYLGSKINTELQIPPTRLIRVD